LLLLKYVLKLAVLRFNVYQTPCKMYPYFDSMSVRRHVKRAVFRFIVCQTPGIS